MDTVLERAQEPGAGGVAQQLVQALAQIPGWDEKNFQVRTSWGNLWARNMWGEGHAIQLGHCAVGRLVPLVRLQLPKWRIAVLPVASQRKPTALAAARWG